MEQMKKYSCFLTEKGDVVVVIPFLDKKEPENPKILYAGAEHALFYKTEREPVILDYLNEVVRPFLAKATRVLLFEVNLETQDIVKDYFVPVSHVKKLPPFSLEVKFKQKNPTGSAA